MPVDNPSRVAEVPQFIDLLADDRPQQHAMLWLQFVLYPRPGELRLARWGAFELAGTEPVWRLVSSKTGIELIKPLPPFAARLLREQKLRCMRTGLGDLVFPGAKAGRPISDMTLRKVLRVNGFEDIDLHATRALARTRLDERLGFRVDWVEQEPGQMVRDALGRAYNRAAHLDQRRQMQARWEGHLRELASGKLAANGAV